MCQAVERRPDGRNGEDDEQRQDEDNVVQHEIRIALERMRR